MDDIVDTANTLCQGAKALKENGAKKVIAYCTHPVLSGQVVQRIEDSSQMKWLSQIRFLYVTKRIGVKKLGNCQ